MHKPLSHAEVEALNSATPVAVMTRAKKLERWATLLAKTPLVWMAHNLEYLRQDVRDGHQWVHSPMSVAAADPVFKDAGLAGDTIKDVKDFFEITDEDVHAFTCNCGGTQTGEQMASRIRNIASGGNVVNRALRGIFG